MRLESTRGQSVIEAVHGAETIRTYRTQDRHLGELAGHSELAIARQRDGVRLRNRFTGLLNAAEFLGLAAVLVTGFVLLGSGAVTVGAATAAALYFHRLFGPVGALLGSLDDIQRATAGLSRLVGIIDLGRESATGESGAGPGDGRRANAPADARHRPAIDVKGVSFSYDGARDALRDVSLHVPPGTSLALVGASGSGKSTLARLIAGLGEPDRGEITTGRAESAPDPARYLVTQETHLFGGTLADNLRIARPAATDDELRRALHQAGSRLGAGTGVGDRHRPRRQPAPLSTRDRSSTSHWPGCCSPTPTSSSSTRPPHSPARGPAHSCGRPSNAPPADAPA